MAPLWDKSKPIRTDPKKSIKGSVSRTELAQYNSQFKLMFKLKEEQNVFVCPVCVVAYQLEQANLVLSKAHIWPKALGGQLSTILCRSCNSQIGTKYESNLVQNERARHRNQLGRHKEEIVVHGETLTARVKATITSNFSNSSPALNFEFNEEQCDPREVEKLDLLIQNKDGKYRLKFSTITKIKGEQIAFLTVAYLAMFRHFGYEFVFTNLGLSMRNAIWNGDSTHSVLRETQESNEFELCIPWIAKSVDKGIGFVIPYQKREGKTDFFVLPGLGSQFHEVNYESNTNVEVFQIGRFFELIAETGKNQPIWSQFYGKVMFASLDDPN